MAGVFPEPGNDVESLSAADARTCIRDLLGLLALSSVWRSRDPRGILVSLLEALESCLPIVLAYGRVPVGGGSYIELARLSGRALREEDAEWRAVADACAKPDAARIETSLGTLHAACAPLGYRGARGRLVVASRRPEFPADAHSVLLLTAACLADSAVETATLLDELRHERELLETRVLERTRELSDSEHRFRALIEASAETVWTADADGLVTEPSPSWQAFSGQRIEASLGCGWIDAVHPEDRERAAAHWQESVASRTPVNLEFRLKHVERGWRWTTVRAVPLLSEDGTMHGWIGMNIDITERKRAEQERERLLQRLVESQEQERRRIARDLHDHVGQQLTALSLGLEIMSRGAGGVTPSMGDLRDIVRRLDTDIELLAWELRPATLDDLGLTSALSTFIDKWSRQFGLACQFHVSGLHERLSPDVETNIFRIVQEALNNVAKHSHAQRLAVILERHDREIALVVEDDGVGFADTTASSGFGLLGMRERAAAIGGTLQIESTPGHGTSVFLRCPAVRPSGEAPE